MKNEDFAFHPDRVYSDLLKYCESDEGSSYASFHKFRFSFMLRRIMPHVSVKMCIANIALSILGPLMREEIEKKSAEYYCIISGAEYLDVVRNASYSKIKKEVYDVTIAHDGDHEITLKYGMELFYETLEHLLAPDGLIPRNLTKFLNNGGLLLGSVPNAVKAERRLNFLLGRNIHWPKDATVDGVFGGFGHIRAYTYSEVTELLSKEYKVLDKYRFSPYGSSKIRKVLNLLPNSWIAVIFFEARKKEKR
ncbi:hypothetical protein Thermo_00528 [Thermoplasmatales archaeon]|nr:hypothetical protein Thermo_00528 [Thermoplasmatales archaeon]